MTEVLKQALEAMKKGVDGQTSIEMDEAITSLRQAIAELESQEPVAWQWLGSAHFRKKIPKNADITAWNPLYHYPPQRTWVGLTDEEITSVANNSHPLNGVRSFARAIEAKLKQKNGFAEEKNT
jgi:hypothetical protein